MATMAQQKGKEMNKQDIPGRSLLLDLENAVLAIEAAGHTDEDIFAFVNMVLKGFIRDGAFAPEYLAMIARIIEERKREQTQRTIDTPPGIIIAKK